ncbi:hypothetical protein [Winogradskya humida]|uniref:Tellurite resistance protein n=1 Tax=Winogradskya humida TaxID=113566 RepID=A0ABQ3ZI70_9ACTN|nr:hypothetical protein [Actinoplanes humidus]GIE18288.1 hypothetical protein Ahu01nite_013900 [Actinoplanes humidus]
MIFNRLFTGEPLPTPLKPLLSVLVSAPAAGGIAWFVIARGHLDPVGYLLLGITFLMVLVQVILFAGGGRLRFTPVFWAFTFPIGATVNLVIHWLAVEGFPGWRAWSWSLAGLATAALLAVAVATVVIRDEKS